MPIDPYTGQENGHLSIFSSNPNRPSDFRCEISKEGPWHAYVLLRAEAWASHTLKTDEKKCGIRSVITKTETRGPYTRPFTVYFVHTKTAFKVKSVCKRFSDFKELHQKLKNKHATFYTPFPPDQVFNSMTPEFVSERRKQLQTYLDDSMAIPEIATDPDLHDFLGIPEYNSQAQEELQKQQQRERQREFRPEDSKPETFLKVIEKAKLDGDRTSEAQGFNALGLLYCESGLENEGLQCMESSLELCRACDNREGMIVVLSNLGCLYNLLERSQYAVGHFQECFDLLEGDPSGQGEAQMKLSLTCAANGDNYEAIEHCLQCLKLCRQLNDHNKEASCLFTLGSIYYEAGEVRQAVEAFEQCLVLRRKTRDKIGLAEALNKLGLTYCDIGYDLRAMDYFEQSLVICEDNADLYGQAVCLQHLGNVFKMQKDNHLAIEFFERCLAVRSKVGDKRGIADCHDSLGLVYYDLGSYAASVLHYSKSLDYRVDLGDLSSESECYRCLGVAYMRLEDTSQAIPAFERCLDIQRKVDNPSAEVDALISLGLAHFKAGNHQSAVKWLEDALDMFQHLSADDASAHSAKALCLDHLGAVYSKIGKPDKAVTFYTMSLRVKKDIGDMTGEARCLVRIGLEFLLLDQLTRAFEAFTEALHMFERLEDDNGISICYENLGDTYMKMGEKKQAIFSYDRCLPIKVETWDKVGEAQCLDNLGLAHYSAGELRLASEYYEQSLAIWRAEGDKHALMLCYESLGGVSFQLGEHMRSIECYVQYLTLSQEIGDGAADHEVLLRLGLSNASIGEYNVALQFLQQAVVFYQEMNDNYNRALCLHHIGAVLGRLGNFEEGMAVLKQSLELRTQSQDKLGIADCLEEMGLMCYNIADYPNARGRFEAAQRLLTETNDKASIATCTMHIGACYAALGQVKEAKQQLQTALMADVHGNWAGKVDCLTHLACVQTILGEQGAVKSLTLALSYLRDKGNRVGEANMLMQLASACAKLNDLPQALDHLEQCLELRKSLDDNKGQADALIKIVYIHSALRNLGRARDAYEECYSLRLDSGDEEGQIECLNARALLAVHEGKMNEGITLHLEALKRLKSQNNTQKSSEVLNNIGVCYSLSGDYGNAAPHLEEAQRLMQHLQLDAYEGKTLINMGTCASEQQDYTAAIDFYEKALLLCRSQVDGGDKAACQMNMGTVSVHLQDFDRAKVCYESALTLLKGRGDKLQEARCYHNLGALMFNKGQTREAIGYFDIALQQFRASKDGRAAMACLHCLKAAHIRLGDAFQASQMIHIMQEIFPEEEVRFLVGELVQPLEAARQRGDKVAEAAAHIELCDAQMDVDMVAATTHGQKALVIRRSLDDKDGQAECFVRLGNIKLLQGETEHALEAFKKAGVALGEVWREGSRVRVEIGADIALGLGSSYLWLERFEEAVHVLNRSLQLHDELGDHEGVYECSNLLAMAYQRLGNVSKATEALIKGVGGELVAESDKPDRVAGTSTVVSTLFQVAKHEDALRAVALYENKLQAHIEQKDQRAQANSYWSLGCAYASIDQVQQSAENFTKCHQLRLLSGESEGLSIALLRKGCANLACGDTRAAAEDLDRYLSMMEQLTDRNQGQRLPEHSVEDECDAAIALSKAYTRLGDVSQAGDVLKRALSSASVADKPLAEAKVVVAFGEMYSGLWITKRALDHYERALNIFVDAGDRDNEAKCILELGRLNFLRGDTATAIKCLEESLALAKKSGTGNTTSQCLLSIGDIHMAQGSYVQTRAHYEEACKKCREQLDPIGESGGLCGLSRIHLVLGETKLALEQAEEALKIRESLGDRKAAAECLCLLAEVYIKMGDLRQAQHVCQQARQLSVENSELLDTARAEVILGRIMAVSGDLSAALDQMQKARDMYAETTLLAGTKIFLDPHALGQVLSELGLLFSKASQGERAIDCLEQAEKICFAADDVGGLSAHQRTLALLLARHGNDPGKPLDKLRLSQEACKKHGNNAGVAEGTLVHGQIASLQSNQAVGVQKIKLAVDMFRDSQDRGSLARALCLLASTSGVSPMGVVQIQDGLDIYKQTQDRIGESEALQQMAELESALSNSAAACKNWLECLDVKRSNGDIRGAKTCLAQLLIEYEKLNDAKRMLEYGAQLNEMARQSDDVDKASHALLHIGKAHTRLKSPAAGIEALSAALQLCETAPNSSKAVGRAAECHEYLSQCYLQANRQQEAMNSTKEAERLRARLGQTSTAPGKRLTKVKSSAAPLAGAPAAPPPESVVAPSNGAPPAPRAPAQGAPAPLATAASVKVAAAPKQAGVKKSSSMFGSIFSSKKTNQ